MKTCKKRKVRQGEAKRGQRRPKKGHGKAHKRSKMEAKWRPTEATGSPMEPKKVPKGCQGGAKRGQGDAKRRPREAKGKPKEANAEKQVSPSPSTHHFGTQNPTKIHPKSLKNGFENNAKFKYVFEVLSVPKILPKPSPKTSKNH